MPKLNLLAEVLVVETALNMTISKVERRQNSLLGKLPIVRSNLESRRINLIADRIRIEAAKQYLISTAK